MKRTEFISRARKIKGTSFIIYKWSSVFLLFLMLCMPIYGEKINVTIITDKKCSFCMISPTQDYLRKTLPVIGFDIIDYRSLKAKKLIKKYGISSLPAFLLPGVVENKPSFSAIRTHAIKKNGYFLLSRDLSGEFMFLDRKEIPSRIDIFFSLYDNNLVNVLKTIRGFCKDKRISFGIHIINGKESNPFMASAQREETERLLAVEMVYPSKFWSYLIKRINNINSTWWIDDMESVGVDYKKIKGLVHSEQVKSIIGDNNMFSRELGIREGIVILVYNKMIFRVYKIKKSDLEKIIGYLQ